MTIQRGPTTWRRRYPDRGYEIRHETWSPGGDDPSPMRCAYSLPDGVWIGVNPTAGRLWHKYGITVWEPLPSGSDHCMIGFSPRDQKWYGWARAIYGFGIGDVVSEGDITAMSGWTDEYLAEHPEKNLSLPVGFTARTLDDARRMAIAFAEGCS